MKSFITFLSIVLLFTACSKNYPSVYEWPQEKTEYKPGVYWWWMGSAVDKKNLTYNIENLSNAGIGGLLIIPIYGVRGNENKYIDFLSDKWIEMLAYASKEAARLKINIDMTTGTGWPFGGSHITKKYAAKKILYNKYEIGSKNSFVFDINPDTILSIRAFARGKKSVDLSLYITKNNRLSWKAPEGDWTVYILRIKGTGQKVKRAAPGNVGLVLDPFSKNAMTFYLQRFNKAFKNLNAPPLRAQYHDSYEYYHADWTDTLFSFFQKINGYNLQEYIPYIFSDSNSDSTRRIKADYRKAVSELHYNYIKTWVKWAHGHNWKTRNEAHGAPANILDTYALSDIPETEVFGSTFYDIPGLRQTAKKTDEPNLIPLITKFSSSAAHVSGKNLVASETCTWLRDHYLVSLAQIKPEVDELFLSGINHIYYHGNAYSPKNARWPGWIFYASTHFEPENTIWKDLPALNKYITRCQSVLQNGKPANDILLYWPVQDIWHSYPELILKHFNVHQIDWFKDFPIRNLAFTLKKRGYDFDYISDKQILNLTAADKYLLSGKLKYKTIIIPECDYIPLTTIKKLYELSSEGAIIIFQRKLPSDVSGFKDYRKNHNDYENLLKNTSFSDKGFFKEAKIGKGYFIITRNTASVLKKFSINSEYFTESGVQYIKRSRDDGGYDYFLVNFSGKKIDRWFPLAVEFKNIIIFDPLEGNIASAKVRKGQKNEFLLQLDAGQSMIIRTTEKNTDIINPLIYKDKLEESIKVNGSWKISFVNGGPKIPERFSSDTLVLWSVLSSDACKYFSGTGKYETSFVINNLESDKMYLLDLGNVYESADVKINNENAGIFWSIPFTRNINALLKQGRNKIEIEVTNLAANRITYLDKMKIDWKKFFFVNINYKKYDVSNRLPYESGLRGPVRIYKYSVK